MPRDPSWPTDATSRTSFCALAGISERMFPQWVAAGIPILQRSSGKGTEWWISPSQVMQWLWHQRSGSAQSQSAEKRERGSNLDASRARLADFQADVQELRAATMRSELLPAGDVVAGWQAASARMRSLLLGIPTASSATIILLARSREPEEAERLVREHLVALIDHALLELSNTQLDDSDEEPAQEAGEEVVPV
jgi:phage terminase Nu1 subunit (DNA packaging protein)